jgi:hypothetical protein
LLKVELDGHSIVLMMHMLVLAAPVFVFIALVSADASPIFWGNGTALLTLTFKGRRRGPVLYSRTRCIGATGR